MSARAGGGHARTSRAESRLTRLSSEKVSVLVFLPAARGVMRSSVLPPHHQQTALLFDGDNKLGGVLGAGGGADKLFVVLVL